MRYLLLILVLCVQAPAEEPENSRPYAYVLPAAPTMLEDLQQDVHVPRHAEGIKDVVHTLQRHGIRVEELREDLKLEVGRYWTGEVRSDAQAGEGGATVAQRVELETRWVHAGSYVIRMGQGVLVSKLPDPADERMIWKTPDGGVQVGDGIELVRIESFVPMNTIDARPVPEDREEIQPLTFEDVYGGGRPPRLNGAPISPGAWLDDEHFLQVKEGRLRRVHAETGQSEPFHDPAKMAEGLRALPTIDQRTADSISRRTSFSMDQGRTAALFEHRGDLYYARFDGSRAVRLTSNPAREELATFSPDGRFVAFVRENDLWVVDVETQRERQLTVGGTDLVRHGKADWVYYEEIFRRNWRVYWWSPDSSRIAYMRVDSRPVRTFTIVDDIPDPPNDQNVEVMAYPKAGSPNPRATLHVVEVAGGSPREVDLSGYNEEDMLIVRVGWLPDGSKLYAYVTNRTQTWMDVLTASSAGGEPTRLFRETTGAWVARVPPLRFLGDGSFLFSSERDGWMHLYHYAVDGELIRRITEGEWEVRGIAGMHDEEEQADDGSGWIYFNGMRDNALGANLYRVRVDGSDLERLTPTGGAHLTSVSPGGRYFTASWSSRKHPTRVALYAVEEDIAGTEASEENAEDQVWARTGSARLVRIIDTNPVRDLERFRRLPVEYVQIDTPRGHVLEGMLVVPEDFDPTLKYPVWFTTYGGPKAASVSDAWMSSRIWDQVVAQRGYVVFRADPYSASGKGAVSAWHAYKRLGEPEVEDIEAAVAWLTSHPWVDPERIGISGHSYGGFLVGLAMTSTELFAAGIAGAPVTDWRLYDTIYTERYMLTPQENPDGYERTSVIARAGDLHGRLLLLHGTMDDNVHLQNATRLLRAFQEAGVQNFEFMLYPGARHSLARGSGARHYQRLVIEFIERTLGPGGGRPVSPEGAPEMEQADAGGE